LVCDIENVSLANDYCSAWIYLENSGILNISLENILDKNNVQKCFELLSVDKKHLFENISFVLFRSTLLSTDTITSYTPMDIFQHNFNLCLCSSSLIIVMVINILKLFRYCLDPIKVKLKPLFINLAKSPSVVKIVNCLDFDTEILKQDICDNENTLFLFPSSFPVFVLELFNCASILDLKTNLECFPNPLKFIHHYLNTLIKNDDNLLKLIVGSELEQEIEPNSSNMEKEKEDDNTDETEQGELKRFGHLLGRIFPFKESKPLTFDPSDNLTPQFNLKFSKNSLLLPLYSGDDYSQFSLYLIPASTSFQYFSESVNNYFQNEMIIFEFPLFLQNISSSSSTYSPFPSFPSALFFSFSLYKSLLQLSWLHSRSASFLSPFIKDLFLNTAIESSGYFNVSEEHGCSNCPVTSFISHDYNKRDKVHSPYYSSGTFLGIPHYDLSSVCYKFLLFLFCVCVGIWFSNI
jgi:hypothetical protein